MATHPRASRSWLLWAVAVTGIAVLIGVLILSLASARLEPSALRLFLVGWIVIPYAVSGALAWWRRPASRLGPLMLLTGFVMGLVPLQWSSQPLLYSVGHLLDMVPAAERSGGTGAGLLGVRHNPRTAGGQGRAGGQPGQRLQCPGQRRRCERGGRHPARPCRCLPAAGRFPAVPPGLWREP